MRKVQTATTSIVRNINRTILLNLIRCEQPISRAELSRRTSMFRSNISSIVDELVQDGMLTEDRTNRAPRGRTPTLLRLNETAHPVLGVYIQPTSTTIAWATLTGTVQKQWFFQTPRTPDQFVERACRTIRIISQQTGIEHFHRIGIAIPGFVNSDSGVVGWCPKLPHFRNYPITAEFQRRTGIPTVADNDGNLGALSELRLAEESHQASVSDNFVFLSIGDFGVGAGIVLNSQLYHGHDSSFAAEFGHTIVKIDGAPCSCERNGCWERYVSNEATWQRYRPGDAFQKRRFADLIEAAVVGEPRAAAAVRETASYLSMGISNIVFALNPAAIMLGGDITAGWEILRPVIEQDHGSPQTSTLLRRAHMQGEFSLVHGTICLALNDVFASPSVHLD